MAKKKSSSSVSKSNAVSKSDAVRAVMAANPNARAKAIKEELDARKVDVSLALINKLISERKRGGAAKKPRRSRSGVSKADAVRTKFNQLGLDARPRDVIAALKAEGVKVTSAQVSMLRAKLIQNGNGTTVSVTASSVPFEHLVAAKQLAERLGGVERARAALESFAQLVSS